MNKKQAVKEIRDITLKYIFIEMEEMEDCYTEVAKKSPTIYRNNPYTDIILYDSNVDEIISIRIYTATEDNRIHVYECPDSLYESITSYDNFKFNIIDCR